jgi:hypothetical protein
MLFSLVLYFILSSLFTACQKWWDVRKKARGAMILGLVNALICILVPSYSLLISLINGVLYAISLEKKK